MPVYDKNDLPHNSKKYTKNCAHCGIEFHSTKPQTKYCSNKCRTYAHLERGKARSSKRTKAELEKELKALKGEVAELKEQNEILVTLIGEFDKFKEKCIHTNSKKAKDVIEDYFEGMLGALYEYDYIKRVKRGELIAATLAYCTQRKFRNHTGIIEFITKQIKEMRQ